jgi:hypothetical protein
MKNKESDSNIVPIFLLTVMIFVFLLFGLGALIICKTPEQPPRKQYVVKIFFCDQDIKPITVHMNLTHKPIWRDIKVKEKRISKHQIEYGTIPFFYQYEGVCNVEVIE